VTDAASLVRKARSDAGLSLRALAERADVSFTTVFRIEHGQLDPTTGTLQKLLGALGQELELGRSTSERAPQLTELSDAWSTDRAGQDQPDWTRLRAFLDHLDRHPEESARAVRSKPPASGSAFFDNLLAGIAEKVSDDGATPRPAWTKKPPVRSPAQRSSGSSAKCLSGSIPAAHNMWWSSLEGRFAWRGLRASTEDVDSATRFDDELRRAVEQVVAAHDLPASWLNDNAAMFLPATFERNDCDVLIDHPRLLVLGAPLKVVFAMKMYRADPNDQADMVTIWPQTGFRSAQEVADAFFAAYPHAPNDPHLDQFVIEVASRAGHSLPLR
jgi:transcriptional regulator with XRE-family HTH domain